MIRRNIDVLAVGLLLAVIGLYSEAREAMMLRVIPRHGIILASDIVHRVSTNLSGCPLQSLRALSFSN